MTRPHHLRSFGHAVRTIVSIICSNMAMIICSKITMALALGTVFLGINGHIQNAKAEEFNKEQINQIEKVIQEYLLENPEIMIEMSEKLEEKYKQREALQQSQNLKKFDEQIYNSSYDAVLGNPDGDVTLVEFFDYNCGFCRRALGDLVTLLENDKNLKVIIKEFPVLGEKSVEAAKVGIVVANSDKDYMAFHTKLLSARGKADGEKALGFAKEVGLEAGATQEKANHDDIIKALKETSTIAEGLGINGTPSYVIGSEVLAGAVGIDVLKTKISNMRECGKTECN